MKCIVLLSAGEYREAQTDSKHGRIATNATFVPPDQIKRYIIIIIQSLFQAMPIKLQSKMYKDKNVALI